MIFFRHGNTLNKYNLIYTNIRSLRMNFNAFVAELNFIKQKIHFIVLSEIWISSDELNMYALPGYNTFANCNNNYRVGGVLCFVDESIDCKEIMLSQNMTSADALVLDIRLNNLYFKLVCLYKLQNVHENFFFDGALTACC